MKNIWEIEYENWLATEQLDDTPERKEGFKVGWEWCEEFIKGKIANL